MQCTPHNKGSPGENSSNCVLRLTSLFVLSPHQKSAHISDIASARNRSAMRWGVSSHLTKSRKVLHRYIDREREEQRCRFHTCSRCAEVIIARPEHLGSVPVGHSTPIARVTRLFSA